MERLSINPDNNDSPVSSDMFPSKVKVVLAEAASELYFALMLFLTNSLIPGNVRKASTLELNILWLCWVEEVWFCVLFVCLADADVSAAFISDASPA